MIRPATEWSGPVCFLPHCLPRWWQHPKLHVYHKHQLALADYINGKRNPNISVTPGSHTCMKCDHECFCPRSSAGGQPGSRDVPENVESDARTYAYVHLYLLMEEKEFKRIKLDQDGVWIKDNGQLRNRQRWDHKKPGEWTNFTL